MSTSVADDLAAAIEACNARHPAESRCMHCGYRYHDHWDQHHGDATNRVLRRVCAPPSKSVFEPAPAGVLVAPAEYEPYEAFSPSSIALARRCWRAFAERYIVGRKEPRVKFADLPPPPAPPKGGKSSAVHKAAVREYNRVMRPALGNAAHEVLHAYFAQNTPGFVPATEEDETALKLDLTKAWGTRPGQVALSGLTLLPHPADCVRVELESPVRLDLSFCTSDPEPPHLHGFKDLVAFTPDVRLYDYKSTYDFQWCKTPEELQADDQAATYALDTMQRGTRSTLDCSWVYFRTEGPPDARRVDFQVARTQAEDCVGSMVEIAFDLRALMWSLPERHTREDRIRLAVEQPQNPAACDDYGGCPYHVRKGGTCKPPLQTLGSQYRNQSARRRVKDTRKQAIRVGGTKGSKDIMETFAEKRARLAAEKAAGGAEAPAPAAAPAATPPKARGATRKPTAKPAAAPVPSTNAADITVESGGVTLVIPPSSPVHAALAEALEAHAAFKAALGLEG